MMDASTIAALIEKLREFDRLAISLELPLSEQLGILNVDEAAYAVLRSGETVPAELAKPELERRLNYALPLMRRLAGSGHGRGSTQSSTSQTRNAA